MKLKFDMQAHFNPNRRNLNKADPRIAWARLLTKLVTAGMYFGSVPILIT
jgi:hypothetical protein